MVCFQVEIPFATQHYHLNGVGGLPRQLGTVGIDDDVIVHGRREAVAAQRRVRRIDTAAFVTQPNVAEIIAMVGAVVP